MYFNRDGHVSTGEEVLDTDLRDLEIVTVNGGTYLYGTTGFGGGMVAYELSQSGGLASVIDRAYYNNAQSQAVGGFVDLVEIDGQVRAVFGGNTSINLLNYAVGGNGTLNGVTQDVNLAGATDDISAVTSTIIGGTSLVFVADAGTGQISSYRQGSDGNYTLRDAEGSVGPVAELEVVQVGQAQYLISTDMDANAVVVHQINTNGTLAEAGRMGADNGLGLSVPTALEVVTAHGETWVIVGGAGSGSMSVMRLEPTGELVPVDHLLDTLNTRFDDVQDIAVVETDGWVFVVAGGSDDGLSLFTLLPSGRMLHLETLEHSLGAGLENVEAISAAVVGTTLQVFVTSTTSGGVTQYSVPLGSLGDVLEGGGTGTGGADLLVASSGGNDTLRGGAGDDILVAGAGDNRLWGEGGRDTFVIGYHNQTVRIMDFNKDEDSIDLSAFPLLYDLSQLSFSATVNGARLDYRDSTVLVVSHDGAPLTVQDLFGVGFDWANHIPIFVEDVPVGGPGPVDDGSGTSGDDTLQGDAGGNDLQGFGGNDSLVGNGGNDTLTGGTGSDMLTGGAGDDSLVGGDGADTLLGGEQNDILNADAGNDLLSGGDGNDTLAGGDGQDTLLGDAGADIISGMNDDDSIDGGDGNDSVWGGAGNDTILGSGGFDLINGGAGNDDLNGGGQNDTLRGNDGNDTMFGGWGADSMSGGNGDDSMTGGDGNDQIWGDLGNDTLVGSNGADTLGGFLGDDWFYGGNGNDVVWGNDGTDRAWGGAGNDTLGGGNDSDTLYGGDDNDLVWGGHDGDLQYGEDGDDTVGGFSGDDTLYGGAGDDQVWGNVGNDIGYGGIGNDTFGGFAGNDTFYGGDGNDSMSGGEGDDFLVGGAGADTFRFVGVIGIDRVDDYEDGVDVLSFANPSLSFDTLTFWQNGSDAVIIVNTGQVILTDTNVNDLGADDFIFG